MFTLLNVILHVPAIYGVIWIYAGMMLLSMWYFHHVPYVRVEVPTLKERFMWSLVWPLTWSLFIAADLEDKFIANKEEAVPPPTGE